jgi:cysteine dioxygenase
MKVLRGTLLETRYSMPKPNAESETPLPPKVIKNTLYTADEVTYMADDLGLHKISNPNVDDVAVSLHRMLSSVLLHEYRLGWWG